jgi:porphyrinogen peroxidase
MNRPQSGIFAVGTPSHAYLEFDLRGGVDARTIVTAVAGLLDPGSTTSGIDVVSGFRPELWRRVAPEGIPRDVTGFNEPVVGVEGFSMPATQHDAVVWLAGSAYDAVFDASRRTIGALAPFAALAEETSGWSYHADRDLTGFIDGSENPPLLDAPNEALVPDGSPGAGGSVLLLQKWTHDVARWEALPETEQERIMGRTKSDSTELDPRPNDSHVARTDQDDFGNVFRRNMPFGSVTRHGTMFVGFSQEQGRLARMLESMAGRVTGQRDALTRYTTPVTGAYYFVPSADAVRAFAPKT